MHYVSQRRFEYVAVSLIVAVVFLWVFLAGKDVNWDLINYHYYGAYQFLEGRVAQDFLAAGVQSYINPIGYLPFYGLIKLGLPSFAIAALLTLVHVCNLLLLWGLSFRLLPGNDGAASLFRVLCVALSAVSPVFLTTVGSSFIDPISSLLIIAALYVVTFEAARCRVFLGSALLGAAIGLKLTNIFFAPAFLGFLFVAFGRSFWNWRVILHGVGGAVAGGILLHGYWGWLLWQEFGNPVFPFANRFFHSPDFPFVSIHDGRFQLGGVKDLLLLPLRMMEARSGIYTENLSPDLRIFPLLLALVWVAIASIRSTEIRVSKWPSALVCFWLLGFLTWLWGSTIGRYALPLWLLAGLLLPVVAVRIMPLRWAALVTGCLLVLQVAHGYVSVGNFRWQPTAWEGAWIDVEVPDTLRNKKAFFLSVGVQTYSMAIPFLHRDSVVTNIVGQYTLPYGRQMLPRLRKMITAWDGDFYVLGATVRAHGEGLPQRFQEDLSALVEPYGFVLAGRPCMQIRLKGKGVVEWAGGGLLNPEQEDYFQMWACPLVVSPPTPQTLERMVRVERIFDTAETACSSLLGPSPTVAMQGRGGWQRLYFNQQAALILKDELVIYRPYLSMGDRFVGNASDLEKGTMPSTEWCH
jgi:hypothetical protein